MSANVIDHHPAMAGPQSSKGKAMLRPLKLGAAATLAALALITGAFAAAAPAASPTNLHATLPVTVTDLGGGGCCFRYAYFAGSAVFPRIGHANITGYFFYGGYVFEDPPFIVHELSLSIDGANGRSIALDALQVFEPGGVPGPPLWTASGSGFTGSGSYDVTLDPFGETPLPGTELTITLEGTLLRE